MFNKGNGNRQPQYNPRRVVRTTIVEEEAPRLDPRVLEMENRLKGLRGDLCLPNGSHGIPVPPKLVGVEHHSVYARLARFRCPECGKEQGWIISPYEDKPFKLFPKASSPRTR